MNAISPILTDSDLATEVDRLARLDDPRRAFLRSRWFTASGDASLEFVVARGGAGHPLLALPLTTRTLGPLAVKQVAGAYWPFRGAPLDRSAPAGAIADAMLQRDVRKALGAAWRLGPVVVDDPAVRTLRDAARLAGWQCLERDVGALFYLDLVKLRASGDWPSNKGKQKDRWRVRQLEKTGPVAITAYTGLEWTARDRDAIAAIEAASWVGQLEKGGDTKFLDLQLRHYWERAATDRAIAAMIRGAILWVGDTPAAFTFGLEAGDTRYCIANNFDKEYNKFSPGRILLYHDFEDAADRGFARIDWGLGDGGYKAKMGAHQDACVVDLLFVRNPVLARVASALWQRGGH